MKSRRSKRNSRARGESLRRIYGASDNSYRAALDAIALMRRNPGMTLERAAELSGTTSSNVRRRARTALTFRGGRWSATAHDTLPRRLRFLTSRGYVSVLTTDSQDATVIADHHIAIRQYLQPPHPTRQLRPFDNLYITSEGKEYDFVTDPKIINRVARASELSFVDIYADEGF